MHILMTYFPNSCALTAEEIKESDKISLKYVAWNEVEWFCLGVSSDLWEGTSNPQPLCLNRKVN